MPSTVFLILYRLKQERFILQDPDMLYTQETGLRILLNYLGKSKGNAVFNFCFTHPDIRLKASAVHLRMGMLTNQGTQFLLPFQKCTV